MAIREVYYQEKEFPISYTIANPQAKESILILHGWGSNKEIMQQAFSKQFKKLKQIYIDMPGFGQSPNESVVLTTQDYANITALFLEAIDQKPKVIAGHSFGGKVATLLKPTMLVLLSSAGILVPKPFKVRAKIALFKLLKPFGIAKFRKLFVADDAKQINSAMYETFKNVVDENFSQEFASFPNKALLFWGKEDTATPLWTGQKIHSLIKNSKLYPLNGDHYFFLHHSDFIAKTIESELE